MFCFTIWLASLAAFQADDLGTSARALYAQASSLLTSERPKLALQPLRAIVEQYSDSEFAIPAAVRMAELQLIDGDAMDAALLLVEWIPRCQRNGDNEQQTADNQLPSEQRMDQLFVAALSRLTEDELNAIVRETSENRNDLPTELDRHVIRELARRATQDGRNVRALELLEQLGLSVTAHERELRDIQLPLAILHQTPSLDSIRQIQEKINLSARESTFKAMGIARYVGMKLAIAEAYRQINEPGSAMEALNALAAELSQLTENSNFSNSSDSAIEAAFDLVETEMQLNSSLELHNWQASVDLRRAELLLQIGNHRNAALLLAKAIESYPNFSLKHELHFLLARCGIAAIDFDRATDELHQILQISLPESEPRSRAFWFLGEIELLKRDYQAAIQHYDQAISLSGQPQWQARSLLQKGKCLELLLRPLEAVSIYQRLVNEFTDFDVCNPAVQRLAILQQAVPPTGVQTRADLIPPRQTNQAVSDNLR